ncbi:TPA: LysR family transcriptional regulator [Pseudomonas aeruginosa]|nr:LysR family transcriptional regulator [Pseudomonas aeruginosa]
MLDNLALFLTIIEKGGLSAAGRELGLSPASVSERLATLEAYYGVTLLTRTTRSINLTDEGRTLAEGARRLLAEADELESRVRLGAQKISGPVRLSAPVDLGQSRIVPIIDRFLQMHPDVTVDLNLTDSFVDLVSQGIDFAVRYGTLADSTLKAKPIGENRRVVCASPDYLARNGTPQHPDDLLQHDCIVMRFGINSDRAWSFRVDGEPYVVTVRGRRIANNGELVRRWCLQGHGLCLKSVWDVQADLASGRLLELLTAFSAGRTGLQIVYPPTRVQPRRVRALMEVITAELSTSCP